MFVRGEVGQDMFGNCSIDGFGLQSAHFIAVCSKPLLQDGIDDVGVVVELDLSKSSICCRCSLWTERNGLISRVRSGRRAWSRSPAPRRLDRRAGASCAGRWVSRASEMGGVACGEQLTLA
jgi:hypothetical protein